MVDVVVAPVPLGDPGDVLDVDDRVGDRLSGQSVADDALDAGMDLKYKHMTLVLAPMVTTPAL